MTTGPGHNSRFEGDAALIEAAEFIGKRGVFGLLWFDTDLIVRRTYGDIAAFVRVGEPVTESLLALIGQEDSIEALKTSPRPVALTIPNVAVMAGKDATSQVRMNITVFWRPEMSFYQVLLGRVFSQDLADQAVEDEIRKRRIADAELARVNQQLEDFAYVISHDLKAPLRALRYYSDDVNEALDIKPPDLDAIHASATNISTATRRMGNMLTGLLEFARLGRQQEAIETVETAALVDDIIGSIGRPEGLRVVRTGTWPTIRSAVAPFDLMLRNLVDNAVKHHDIGAGEVVVQGDIVGSHLEICVIDDGSGIPTDWHDAIFEPFRRIDDNKSPESSGIGLALVKRTIELAGGRIEVHSDPDTSRGTTFRVYWPLGR
jgi:signal transduction histidine kinase